MCFVGGSRQPPHVHLLRPLLHAAAAQREGRGGRPPGRGRAARKCDWARSNCFWCPQASVGVRACARVRVCVRFFELNGHLHPSPQSRCSPPPAAALAPCGGVVSASACQARWGGLPARHIAALHQDGERQPNHAGGVAGHGGDAVRGEWDGSGQPHGLPDHHQARRWTRTAPGSGLVATAEGSRHRHLRRPAQRVRCEPGE